MTPFEELAHVPTEGGTRAACSPRKPEFVAVVEADGKYHATAREVCPRCLRRLAGARVGRPPKKPSERKVRLTVWVLPKIRIRLFELARSKGFPNLGEFNAHVLTQASENMRLRESTRKS